VGEGVVAAQVHQHQQPLAPGVQHPPPRPDPLPLIAHQPGNEWSFTRSQPTSVARNQAVTSAGDPVERARLNLRTTPVTPPTGDPDRGADDTLWRTRAAARALADRHDADAARNAADGDTA
jgi:hypothetical protein